MKYFILMSGIISICCIASCKKNSHSPASTFTAESAVGIWVPYALVVDGVPSGGQTLDNTDRFRANAIFGDFAESVQLNADKTFIPVRWTDTNNFVLFPAESGTYEYLSGNKLRFSGIRPWEADIAKFQEDDLWLAMHVQAFYIGPGTSEYLYKFKRLH